ncbi:surfactant protein Bb isoform X2 [Anguilla anguilla]|uniref:surfactant protein Bb isoform X2 n=1 Tax=Anguilla anguilla TaxID=7936 RepID=UPI0015A8F263|nr:surfactant protein Bb isoform X2 [Anguilla anguilla]
MTASGFVLVALLASQSAVLARVLLEPTQARLDSTKLSAKPGQVCTFLGLCGSQSEGKEVELLTNHIADGDMTSVAPFRGTHPEVQWSPQCTFCLFLVKKLESMLGTEKTEDAVVKLLNEVCAILPHSFRAQCEGFIAKYAKQLIEFLLSSAAPHTVCMLLHLCLVQELPLVEMPPLSPCDSCQTLTALSRIHLGSNLTEHGASSFLESVCELHPHAVPKCQIFTQRYGSRLQRILGKQEDALDMCEREDLCAAGSEAMMLGGNHCTWGRDYVCANMKTALECDSVLFCEKFMWN